MSKINCDAKIVDIKTDIELTIAVSKDILEDLQKLSHMTSRELHEELIVPHGDPAYVVSFESEAGGCRYSGFFDYFLSDIEENFPTLYAEVLDEKDKEYRIDEETADTLYDGSYIVLTCQTDEHAPTITLKIQQEEKE